MSETREPLFRSATFELRAADGDEGGMPTMVVNFARFNEWTEINDWYEGRFLEQFAPGAFTKTFKEQREQMRSLFQHGRDPVAGIKPLGPITDLRQQTDGAWGEVDLLDADYVHQIVPGLRAGLYGASFAFIPVKREINDKPARSQHNPDGIPEHTVREAMVREFGPVTFPAYPGTSTGVRSLTGDLLYDRLMREQPDKLRDLLAGREDPSGTETSSGDEPEPATTATPLLDAAELRFSLMKRCALPITR